MGRVIPSDRGETKVRYRGEEYESRNREPDLDRTPEATEIVDSIHSPGIHKEIDLFP